MGHIWMVLAFHKYFFQDKNVVEDVEFTCSLSV